MEKVITNQYGFRKSSAKTAPESNRFTYKEKLIESKVVLTLKARYLAIAIFLYFFIENGTLGLIPEKYYMVYRNMRISDFILYGLIIYSAFCIKEFIELFKSRSLLIIKILFIYIIAEFVISTFNYKFNPIEYFFRLKLLWSSFLIFPYLLLLKRNGFSFLIKLIFPLSIVSNFLYILTALTGTAFLPDVFIFTQQLPGDIVVYRVFGGTFFGDLFFFGIVYNWLNKKFKWYQIFFAILFIMPHILAFGRSAWIAIFYTLVVIIVVNTLKKRRFKILLRQLIIIAVLGIAVVISFIKFIPESDYYIEALEARIFQGNEDVKHNEGTYGERVIFQNNSLVQLWSNSNWLVGIGMHPMWVYRPESKEEQVYYAALSDVTWPSVLAVYGIIGLFLALVFQYYYIRTTYKLVKKSQEADTGTMLLIVVLAKFTFDTFINFSYSLVTFTHWGVYGIFAFYIALIVYTYEKQKNQNNDSYLPGNKEVPKYSYTRYNLNYSKPYKYRE